MTLSEMWYRSSGLTCCTCHSVYAISWCSYDAPMLMASGQSCVTALPTWIRMAGDEIAYLRSTPSPCGSHVGTSTDGRGNVVELDEVQ